MNTVRFTLAATLLASAAATAADLPLVLQDEASGNGSVRLGLLEELASADGKPVPAFDLPLVVRDEHGNIVLDARSEGPLPLTRLTSSATGVNERESRHMHRSKE